MGLIHSENLAEEASEFRRLSIRRLIHISDYLESILDRLQAEEDPDYGALANDMDVLRLSVGQVEFSFREVSMFLDSLKQKVEKGATE